jgi:hypothetical protein
VGLFDNALFGTPPTQPQDSKDPAKAPVQAPEFDITQYAKKLAVVVGVIAPAILAALKLFKVDQITPGIVIGALALTAVALLSVSLVMAVDVATRGYLTRGTAPTSDDEALAGTGGQFLVAAPPGALAWLEGQEDPRPVLAIAGDGKSQSSYLVAAGSELRRPVGATEVSAHDGAPQWQGADKVNAYYAPDHGR